MIINTQYIKTCGIQLTQKKLALNVYRNNGLRFYLKELGKGQSKSKASRRK